MSHQVFYAPDWLIVGIPRDDGVMVVASRSLLDAAVEAKWDEPPLMLDFKRAVSPPTTYHFTTRMTEVVMCLGATYGEALAGLMGYWSPDGEQSYDGPRMIAETFEATVELTE